MNAAEIAKEVLANADLYNDILDCFALANKAISGPPTSAATTPSATESLPSTTGTTSVGAAIRSLPPDVKEKLAECIRSKCKNRKLDPDPTMTGEELVNAIWKRFVSTSLPWIGTYQLSVNEQMLPEHDEKNKALLKIGPPQDGYPVVTIDGTYLPAPVFTNTEGTILLRWGTGVGFSAIDSSKGKLALTIAIGNGPDAKANGYLFGSYNLGDDPSDAKPRPLYAQRIEPKQDESKSDDPTEKIEKIMAYVDSVIGFLGFVTGGIALKLQFSESKKARMTKEMVDATDQTTMDDFGVETVSRANSLGTPLLGRAGLNLNPLEDEVELSDIGSEIGGLL